MNTIFEVGQEIKVVIKQIDEYQNRMSLSIKALEEYPGENIEKLAQVMANADERWQKAQSSAAEATSANKTEKKASLPESQVQASSEQESPTFEPEA